MARGRPPNLLRAAARDAGERFYSDDTNPCFCGCAARYTSNAQCVECTNDKARARYHALDGAELADLKVRDHERYVEKRKLAGVADRKPGRPKGWRKKKSGTEAIVDDSDFA